MTNNQIVKVILFLQLSLVAEKFCYGESQLNLDSSHLPSIHTRNHNFLDERLSFAEALEFAKKNHPSIQIKSHEIAFAQGELQVEAGAFDPQISAEFNRGISKEIEFDTDEDDNPISFEFDESFMDFQADVTKRFRGGQTASLGFAVDYEDIEDSGTGATSQSEVFIQLIQPLLKNRGGSVTGAQEQAANMIVEARKLDFKDSISSNLLDTAEAYWDYLEKQKILELRQETTYPIENLVASLNAMKSLQSNKVETEEAEAELYLRNTNLAEARQEYFIARHQLGLAMGLVSYKDIENLPAAEGGFLEFNKADLSAIRGSIPVYLRRAEHQRASVLSLKRLQESTLILFNAAKRDFEPQLDLVAKYGYFGTEDESSIPGGFGVVKNDSDPTWLIGGVFNYQLGKNAAKGELAQQKALLSELNLRLYTHLGEISSDIIVTVEALINISKKSELTAKSIKLYQNALVRQKKDLLGDPDLGTLLDFINIQNDWIQAKIDQIEYKNEYSQAVANLAFESGQILDPGTDFRINTESLTAIP